jgi:lysophospholipase L1-like esterase
VTSDLAANHNTEEEGAAANPAEVAATDPVAATELVEGAAANPAEVAATDPVAATELVEVVPDTSHNDDPVEAVPDTTPNDDSVSEEINPAPATSVLIQCDLAPFHNLDPSDVDQRIADAKVSVKNEMKLLFKTQIENLSNTISSLLARVTEQDKQIRILKSQHGDLKKMVVKPQSHSCTQTVVPQPVNTDTQTADNDVTNNAVSDKSLQHDHLTDTDADFYSVPVMNKFSPLDKDSSDNAASVSSKKQSIVSTQAKPDNQRPRQIKSAASPREKMMQAEVLPATTHVLLGDSVLARVKGQDVFPRGTKFQNLSVSGLTVADLITWLRQAPVRQNVLTVVVHVGVNTCKYTGVTDKVWRDLLHSVSRCFPFAEIAASSIVPPCEPLTLQRTVHNSNAGLWRVCTQEHIIFVDHRPAFLTDTGALRYNLYGDAVHPSARGTLAVAGNIRSALRKTENTPDPSTLNPIAPSAPLSKDRVPLLPNPQFPGLPHRNIASLLPVPKREITGHASKPDQSESDRTKVTARHNRREQSQRDLNNGQPEMDPTRGQHAPTHLASPGNRTPNGHLETRGPSDDLSQDTNQQGPLPFSGGLAAADGSSASQPLTHSMIDQCQTNQATTPHGSLPASALFAAGGYGPSQFQQHQAALHGPSPVGGLLAASGYGSLQNPLQMAAGGYSPMHQLFGYLQNLHLMNQFLQNPLSANVAPLANQFYCQPPQVVTQSGQPFVHMRAC